MERICPGAAELILMRPFIRGSKWLTGKGKGAGGPLGRDGFAPSAYIFFQVCVLQNTFMAQPVMRRDVPDSFAEPA